MDNWTVCVTVTVLPSAEPSPPGDGEVGVAAVVEECDPMETVGELPSSPTPEEPSVLQQVDIRHPLLANSLLSKVL